MEQRMVRSILLELYICVRVCVKSADILQELLLRLGRYNGINDRE